MFEPVESTEPIEIKLHYLHVLKDVKPQARIALLTSVSDELIKDIFECGINTLNGNHESSKKE